MTNPEQKVKNKLILALKEIPDAYYFSVSEPSRRGLPDMVACIRGRFIGIELKAHPPPYYDARFKLQRENSRRIQKAQGIGAIINPSNIDLFIKFINDAYLHNWQGALYEWQSRSWEDTEGY